VETLKGPGLTFDGPLVLQNEFGYHQAALLRTAGFEQGDNQGHYSSIVDV